MNHESPALHPTRWLAAFIVMLAVGPLSCQSNQTSESPAAQTSERAQSSTTQPPKPNTDTAERIAHAIIDASLAAAAGDSRARDLAAERLARLGALLDATYDHVLWGEFDDELGYDLKAYRLTELCGEVWARLYLSCFTLSQPFTITKSDGLAIVEIPAKFRDKLQPGEYPHPFWHSAEEWSAYANTGSLILCFESDRLVCALFKSRADGASAAAPPIEWNDQWTWTDSRGTRQPRVAQFNYLLSRENPHLRTLDKAYQQLYAHFESQNCLACHSPTNRGKARVLYLLGYPNQALAARELLVDVLTKNSMPPANPAKRWAKGIHDEAVRVEMLRLAEEFRDEGDAALSYESIYILRPEEYPAR